MAGRFAPDAVTAGRFAPLVADLRAHAFTPRPGRPGPRCVGVEVELLATGGHDGSGDGSGAELSRHGAGAGSGRRDAGAGNGRPEAVWSNGRPGAEMIAAVRRFARERGWAEESSPKGAPTFLAPGGGRLTFEPGGQVEYSTPPHPSATAALDELDAVVPALIEAAAAAGVELRCLGIDPCVPVEQAPLCVPTDRYRRMAEYFATLGADGARMMRQTASVQVNLDFQAEPLQQWSVLNAAAPYVVAIFANSPRYAGAETGHRSYRARVWRRLDPARTGILPCAGDPVAEYAAFALNAPALLGAENAAGADVGSGTDVASGAGVAGYRPFAEHAARGRAATGDWHEHLSTLFPEVRPRGYLEIRSPDALEPEWYAAPVALLAGIAYHGPSLRAAAELLGPPDPARLERAGASGLADPVVRATAADLFELGLGGCDALGPAFIAERHLDAAHRFFDRYTRCGRCPADDVEAPAAAVLG